MDSNHHTPHESGGVRVESKSTPGAGRESDRSSSDAHAQHLRDDARQTAAKGKPRFSAAGDRLRESAQRAGEAGKRRTADELRSLGVAAEGAAEQGDKEGGNAARAGRYAASVQRGLNDAADYIEHTELADLRDDAEEFARRNTAVTLGGMALLGFAVGRLLSTRPAPAYDDSDEPGFDEDWADEDGPSRFERTAADPASSRRRGPTAMPTARPSGHVGGSTTAATTASGASSHTQHHQEGTNDDR